MKVAILFVCIGDYSIFWREFRASAEKALVPDAERSFIVFSDQPVDRFPGADHVVYQDNLGWPLNTLYRFRMFLRISDLLRQYDNVVFFNANCEFCNVISATELFGSESDLVACRHPGFYNKSSDQFTYERRTESSAYVAHGSVYVAGGLMGGRTSVFLEVCKELHSNIEADFDRGVLAIWHDESHWNAFINHRAPALGQKVHLLDPGFLYPEGWQIPFTPRIMLREKSKYVDVHRIKGQVAGLAAQRRRKSVLRMILHRIARFVKRKLRGLVNIKKVLRRHLGSST
jgi:hypothetical protein